MIIPFGMIPDAEDFIPSTMARAIGDGVYFRPIRSWHSGTYAGERLQIIPDANDRSGCVRMIHDKGFNTMMCNPPLTVTHRLYWYESDIEKTISAFLSYPNGMGAMDKYFWEIYYSSGDKEIERFIGPDAEEEMEQVIKEFFKLIQDRNDSNAQ